MSDIRIKFPDDPASMADFRTACLEYILPGYAPAAPIFEKSAKVVTAGSCFAQNLSQALARVGMRNVTHVNYTEATNSASATLTLLTRSLIGKDDHISDALRQADLFVLTLGVGFGAFVDGQPVLFVNKATASRMKWRFLSPDETGKYLIQVLDLLQVANPRLTVVLTLSPLPLNSSLVHPSVVAADCLSKSILRVGIEGVISQQRKQLFYWPSFEMVRWLAPHRGQCFGMDGADNRHISPHMTDDIMSLFLECYFHKAAN
jgi:hypothetical protein